MATGVAVRLAKASPTKAKIRSNFANISEVRSKMLLKLQESALTVQDAKLLHLHPYTATEVATRLAPLPFHRAGIHIPYFDLHGRQTKFYRFRYLEYDNASGFAALVHSNGNGNGNSNGLPKALKHDVRYVQPEGTVPQLYMPPLADLDWHTIAKDTDTALVLTEGEFKAACACKHGIPTVGLGGVWSFRSSKAGMPLIPIFKEFEWAQRRLYICYDSDEASNANIAQAKNALAHQLMKLGALVYMCTLPNVGEAKKTGLDDYIVALGAENLKTQVLAVAREWQASRELYELNDEVVYVNDPGVIMRLATLQRMTPRAFVDHAYANRIWIEAVPLGNGGNKLVEHSAPREWLKWQHRATVERVTYKPGEPKFLLDGQLNVWSGWNLQPAAGDISMWHELMDYVFTDYGENEEMFKQWFQQWLAYPLQFPGTKLNQSVVLWSVAQGTGKSLIGYTMRQIYGKNFSEITDKNLQGSFNEWAENKQFVMGDEIASSGERKRDTADRMKSLITQRELRLNPKFVPSYAVPDCINYYFTSNHSDAFFMEDSDRRFFVIEIKGGPKPGEFYDAYAKWAIHGPGCAAIFDYLLHLDLTGYSPQSHAPRTSSKDEMIESGRSDVGSWVAKVRNDPEGTLQVAGAPRDWTLWSTEDLYAIYDPNKETRVSVNGLARELRRAGFRRIRDGAQIRTQTRGIQRLWAIRNADELLAIKLPKKIATIYDRERGNQPKGVKF